MSENEMVIIADGRQSGKTTELVQRFKELLGRYPQAKFLVATEDRKLAVCNKHRLSLKFVMTYNQYFRFRPIEGTVVIDDVELWLEREFNGGLVAFTVSPTKNVTPVEPPKKYRMMGYRFKWRRLKKKLCPPWRIG